MPKTNRERLERLGMSDYETILEVSVGKRCKICNEKIQKNLSPTNPCCEGEWCDKAVDLWLDEEEEEEDYE